MYRFTLTALTATALLALNGCSDPAEPDQQTSAQSSGASETAMHSWLLTSAPAGDISITQAKSDAAEGDQVVIRGRIGGRSEPISDQSPVFTIVDLDLEYCGQSNDDACGTPWDYCCETPGTIATHSATVQVVGDSIGLSSAGLEPLDEVVLIGTVGPRPDDQVLTIRATGVYRVGG